MASRLDNCKSASGPLIICLLCFFFLVRLWAPLDMPSGMIGDEAYYIPGARAFLSADSLDPNFVHPPLAKMIISLFIRIFGDNPYGWRAGSMLFGALSMILSYYLGLALLKSRTGGFLCGVLVSLSFLHIVNSRIATLDIFVSFFILGGLLYSYRHMEDFPHLTVSRWSALGSLFLGFALCCKLSGASALGAAGAYFLWCGVRGILKKDRILPLFLFYGSVIAGVFLLCHIPLFVRGAPLSYITYSEVRELHYTMNFSHPSLSSILQWFLLNKPFVYHYLNNQQAQTLSCVFGYANYIFWWGFPGLFVLKAIETVVRKKPGDAFMVISFLFLYLFWLLSFQVRGGIFRFKGGFLYYMLPCIPFMAALTADYLKRALEFKSGWINGALYFCGIGYFLIRFYPLLTGAVMPYSYFKPLFEIDLRLVLAVVILLNLQLFTGKLLSEIPSSDRTD